MTEKQRLRTIKFLRDGAGAIAKHAFMMILVAVMLGPLLWMATSSLKTVKQTMAYPPEFIPKPVVWSNFSDAWEAARTIPAQQPQYRRLHHFRYSFRERSSRLRLCPSQF